MNHAEVINMVMTNENAGGDAIGILASGCEAAFVALAFETLVGFDSLRTEDRWKAARALLVAEFHRNDGVDQYDDLDKEADATREVFNDLATRILGVEHPHLDLTGALTRFLEEVSGVDSDGVERCETYYTRRLRMARLNRLAYGEEQDLAERVIALVCARAGRQVPGAIWTYCEGVFPGRADVAEQAMIRDIEVAFSRAI